MEINIDQPPKPGCNFLLANWVSLCEYTSEIENPRDGE